MKLQEATKQVVKDIYAKDYYVSLFERILSRSGVTRQQLERGDISDQKIVALMNDFWFALPDTGSIRREPFFTICDIAEHMFDEEVEA